MAKSCTLILVLLHFCTLGFKGVSSAASEASENDDIVSVKTHGWQAPVRKTTYYPTPNLHPLMSNGFNQFVGGHVRRKPAKKAADLNLVLKGKLAMEVGGEIQTAPYIDCGIAINNKCVKVEMDKSNNFSCKLVEYTKCSTEEWSRRLGDILVELKTQIETTIVNFYGKRIFVGPNGGAVFEFGDFALQHTADDEKEAFSHCRRRRPNSERKKHVEVLEASRPSLQTTTMM